MWTQTHSCLIYPLYKWRGRLCQWHYKFSNKSIMLLSVADWHWCVMFQNGESSSKRRQGMAAPSSHNEPLSTHKIRDGGSLERQDSCPSGQRPQTTDITRVSWQRTAKTIALMTRLSLYVFYAHAHTKLSRGLRKEKNRSRASVSVDYTISQGLNNVVFHCDVPLYVCVYDR